MIPAILAVAIPAIVMFFFTRLITNIIIDIVYVTIKLLVLSTVMLCYRCLLFILWLIFLPLTLLSKMVVSKSSPLRWLVLLSLMALSTFVVYDVREHGGFQKSQTGRALEDVGVLKYYNLLAAQAKVQYDSTSKWFSKNGPTVLKQAADFIKPYLVLMKNLLIIFSNVVVNGVISLVKYVAVKLPLLHEAIESYCPGITEWSQKTAQNAWQSLLQFVQYLLVQGLTLLSLVLQHLRQALATSVEFLQKNVFVGEYSPENLQKMAVQGVGVAQQYIQTSVTWISEKLTNVVTSTP